MAVPQETWDKDGTRFPESQSALAGHVALAATLDLCPSLTGQAGAAATPLELCPVGALQPLSLRKHRQTDSRNSRYSSACVTHAGPTDKRAEKSQVAVPACGRGGLAIHQLPCVRPAWAPAPQGDGCRGQIPGPTGMPSVCGPSGFVTVERLVPIPVGCHVSQRLRRSVLALRGPEGLLKSDEWAPTSHQSSSCCPHWAPVLPPNGQPVRPVQGPCPCPQTQPCATHRNSMTPRAGAMLLPDRTLPNNSDTTENRHLGSRGGLTSPARFQTGPRAAAAGTCT
nr:uncharacterized protein LOC123478525 isoform X2 [Desmodus rotundus]